MKLSRHSFFRSAALALCCAIAGLAFGQETTPPAAPKAPQAAPPAAAPDDRTPPASASAAEQAPAAETPAPEPALRRIDEPNTPAAAAEGSRQVNVRAGVESDEAGRKGVVTVEEKAPDGSVRRQRSYETRGRGDNQFPMGDHHVGAGSKASEVVSIMGSTTVDGEVASDAVSVLGNTTVGPDAKVGGAAVAVLGKLDVQGSVKDEAVSVLGGTRIDGPVGGEAVAVLGNMQLGPKAVVNGDLVVVGGKLTRDPEAVVKGEVVHVPILGGLGDMDWLTTWVKRCLLWGRPLAFGEHLGWAWMIALSFLALYVLLALVFPGGVNRCVETLNTRPGASIVASILTVLLTPVVLVLLVFTVVGALLVPFAIVGLAFATLFGKAAMLAWLGGRVGRIFTGGSPLHAALAVLIGGVIVLALYVVPILGFLVFKVLGWLGLGLVVYTIILRMKREKPVVAPRPAPIVPPGTAPTPAPSPPPAGGAVAGMAAGPEPTVTSTPSAATPGAAEPDFPMPPLTSAGFTGGGAAAAAAGLPLVSPVSVLPPASAVTLPRASLWLRLGALFLDVILVGLIVGLLSDLLPRAMHYRGGPPGVLLALAIYGAIMWKLKGTTIGGIICGLKVVRADGREFDWATAIVRALGCFLSLFVAGLGFIWIAIDDDRQGWHDKIAGTVVVRVPKGVSLL